MSAAKSPEVECQDGSILGQDLREHLLVERPVQTLVPKVNGVMTVSA